MPAAKGSARTPLGPIVVIVCTLQRGLGNSFLGSVCQNIDLPRNSTFSSIGKVFIWNIGWSIYHIQISIPFSFVATLWTDTRPLSKISMWQKQLEKSWDPPLFIPLTEILNIKMKKLKYAGDVTSLALKSFMVTGLGGQADLWEAWGRAKQQATTKPEIDEIYD